MYEEQECVESLWSEISIVKAKDQPLPLYTWLLNTCSARRPSTRLHYHDFKKNFKCFWLKYDFFPPSRSSEVHLEPLPCPFHSQTDSFSLIIFVTHSVYVCTEVYININIITWVCFDVLCILILYHSQRSREIIFSKIISARLYLLDKMKSSIEKS